MAETIKVLGQAAPGATTETDVYTVPALTSAVVSNITICNRGSAATTFRLSIAVAGAATENKQYLVYDENIAGNRPYEWTTGITLGAGDVVRLYSGNNQLSINVFGKEVS